MIVQAGSGLRRGLAVLQALGSEQAVRQGGLGVVRVAELVGEDKSQVSRTLATLAEEGYVERSADTRSYRLGWRLYALAGQAGDRRLLAAAAPTLERLVAELGETAHLSVLRGPEVLTVLSRSPQRAVQAVGWVGRVTPASSTSAGRVLLFDHSEAELDALFGGGALERPTSRAPGDTAELARRVAADAGRGWAVVDGELEPGLTGVAAPVRDPRGRIVAALNVSGPTFRLETQLPSAAAVVAEAADDLARTVNSGRPLADEEPTTV